jgi:hypothetical protein
MSKIGSSETIRKTTFNFNHYAKSSVSHKKTINQNFLEWFIGFSEGDGSFIVSNNRLFFIINQKEEKILHYIRSNLGFGKVSNYKFYSRYIVANKTNVDKLISIFNGNLVLSKTNLRFINWLEARNLYSIHCPTLSEASPTGSVFSSAEKNFVFSTKEKSLGKDEKIEYLNQKSLLSFNDNAWLSGFIDAEGCFNASKIKNKAYSLGFRVRLRFILDQKDESFIFIKLKNFLESGVISNRSNNNKTPKLENMFRFTTTSIYSHEKLITYLNKFPLRTFKKVSFVRFCSLLNYIINRKTLPWQGKVLQKVENLLSNIAKQEKEI